MNRSGSIVLVDGVRAFFRANGVKAEVRLGWKEPARQDNQDKKTGAGRVIFTPSDPGGRGGALSKNFGARGPGPSAPGAPRPLVCWEKRFTVRIWAVATGKEADEEAQIQATEDLFERTVQAVQYVAAADAEWLDTAWETEPTEQTFGKALLVALVHRGPLFGVEHRVVYPQPEITKELSE